MHTNKYSYAHTHNDLTNVKTKAIKQMNPL